MKCVSSDTVFPGGGLVLPADSECSSTWPTENLPIFCVAAAIGCIPLTLTSLDEGGEKMPLSPVRLLLSTVHRRSKPPQYQ